MKKKIYISIFELKDIGGISTSAYNFINTIHPYFDIDICVLTNYITPRYHIPEDVNVLPAPRIINDLFSDISRLRGLGIADRLYSVIGRSIKKIIGHEKTLRYVIKTCKNNKEYDAALAFWDVGFTAEGKMYGGWDYFNVLKNINAKKKLAWVHNDATKMGITHSIAKQLYANFDGIINVSYDCKRIFDNIIPEYTYKSYVIYNCYSIDEIKAKMNEENPFDNNGKLHFVTVCRMNEHQKRVSRIVDVCKRLKCEGYDNFDWTVVGDGADKATYESTSQANGTTDILHFVGLKSNPYPYMKHADAFILSSLYEGFGMTIREAQITGTPTFSTRFGAAEEAIEVGKQGEICDNSTEGLYAMLKGIFDKPDVLISYRKHLQDNPITNSTAFNQFKNILNK